MNNFEELWKLKCDSGLGWFSKIITARVKKDVEMHVWNQRHPVEENTAVHICKAGTRVRVWMVSRFGDVGVTDNLDNPHGYDARIDPEDIEDLHIEDASPRKDSVTIVTGENSFFMSVAPHGQPEPIPDLPEEAGQNGRPT